MKKKGQTVCGNGYQLLAVILYNSRVKFNDGFELTIVIEGVIIVDATLCRVHSVFVSACRR